MTEKIFVLLITCIFLLESNAQIELGDTPCSAPNITLITGNCSSANWQQFRSNSINTTFTEFLTTEVDCAEIEHKADGWIKFTPTVDVIGIRLYERGGTHSYYFYKQVGISNCPIVEPTLEFLFCEAGAPQQFELTTIKVNPGTTYYIKVRKSAADSDDLFFEACLLNWPVYNNCGDFNSASCNISGPYTSFSEAINFPFYSACSQLPTDICNPICETIPGNIFSGLEGNMLYEMCTNLTSSPTGSLGVTGYFIANTSCAADNNDKTKNIRRSFNFILFESNNYDNPIYSKYIVEDSSGSGWEWHGLNSSTAYKLCGYATIANTNCLLNGTCTRYYYPEPLYDCPSLMLNVGDACDDGDTSTINDVVNMDCICEGQQSYDCPSLLLNVGDACDDGDTSTINDVVNIDCICEGQQSYDCPSLMLNVGDPCDDGDTSTIDDIVVIGCICNGLIKQIDYYAPNVISLTNDSSNNCFQLYFRDDLPLQYELKIFNRWGNLVFQTIDTSECWDGKIGNIDVETGVYIYRILMNQEYVFGSITLI